MGHYRYYTLIAVCFSFVLACATANPVAFVGEASGALPGGLYLLVNTREIGKDCACISESIDAFEKMAQEIPLDTYLATKDDHVGKLAKGKHLTLFPWKRIQALGLNAKSVQVMGVNEEGLITFFFPWDSQRATLKMVYRELL